MGGKDLFLLLQNVTHFLLESKELFVFLVSHCSLHSVQVVLDFFLVLSLGLFFNLNFLVDNVLVVGIIFLFLFLVGSFIALFVERWIAAECWVFWITRADHRFFV